MTQLDEYRQRSRAAREDRARVEANLDRLHNLLRRRKDQLAQARRQGKAGTERQRALLEEIKSLEGELAGQTRSAQVLRGPSPDLAAPPQPEEPPWQLVEGLDDRLPFLLLPVRIETRFMTVEGRSELWVRFFPDDLAAPTHEASLTADEVNSGTTYWKETWNARQKSNANMEKGAWRALAQAYGAPRAAWVKDQTKPANFEIVASAEELQFPDFPEGSLKPESWSQSPRSNVMPDRFVLMGFRDGAEVFRQAGNRIESPLIVGPNPREGDQEFQQVGGELKVGPDIAWIYDFERAVEIGMGMRIELDALSPEQGFDQLFVLGLRLSEDEAGSQALVEQLFEHHSYSPDGLAFVPQGTPTNNTERQGSGFSHLDPGAETSFTLETAPVLAPVNGPFQKRDGQRLVEAFGLDYSPLDPAQGPSLGIGHTPLQRVRHADRGDVRIAMLMNRALCNATLDYYMEQMLGIHPDNIEKISAFFRNYITGCGLLPAFRAGTQPYGLVVTSDFSAWRWSPELDGHLLPELNHLYGYMLTLRDEMNDKLPGVARIGAGENEDPFNNLLRTLGLQASSVEFHRRRGIGLNYLWNYAAFRLLNFGVHDSMLQAFRRRAGAIVDKFNISLDDPPNLLRLLFFHKQDPVPDPVVDDIPAEETEKLSETKQLRRIYKDPRIPEPDVGPPINYISWLALSPYSNIRSQRFVNPAGEDLPVPPRPLLYRMLRTALLQALYDAAIRLYHTTGKGPFKNQQGDRREWFRIVRQEVELINFPSDPRQIDTRWELLAKDIQELLETGQESKSVADYLLSDEGLQLPEAANLKETLESIKALADLSTAQLERAFVEHIDLCSYRLDAWQTGFFNYRLLQQRFPPDSQGSFEKRVKGLYLGAFGWLEDLRPAGPMAPADLSSVPTSLHDPQRDGVLFEQPENGGFVHGPSPTHAAAAAILRSTYLTHFDPAKPQTMAVNLSSERVRIALSFLDGVRNGQDLGALLGHQFERGLADHYGDPSLNENIKYFREKYPVLADKITPPANAPDGSDELKEARNVFDGYALLEATFLRESRLEYPYDVPKLPARGTTQANAIECEVAGMAETLDAIADLSLAEGIYQVAQGNFDRAGGMLKAMTQGESPPEPEIVRTPRSGVTVTQRVVLHLPGGGNASRWPGPTTPRAAMEPGLNAWLEDMLPAPNKISYTVSLPGGNAVEQNLARLLLKPIDMVYMIGDDLTGETTELESRITFFNRRVNQNDNLEVGIDFRAEPKSSRSVNLFELLPLLRELRRLVTSSRPLSAGDYQLSSETPGNGVSQPGPQDSMLDDLQERVKTAVGSFQAAVQALGSAIPANGTNGQPDPRKANAPSLRAALHRLANFGVPDAFPHSAFSGSIEAKTTLTHQAISIYAVAFGNWDKANKALEAAASAPAEKRPGLYRSAIQLIFGPSFNLVPAFSLTNQAELEAARDFRDANPPDNLTRYHEGNPLLVEEWIEGASRVRPHLNTLLTINILAENFGKADLRQLPLQLPFDSKSHWIAVEYPETFQPVGEFLSIVQVLPESGFDPAQPQSALLIDEWIETIPGKSELTGIAFHFDQPSTEPPQACLLAVTPEITGSWTWHKLVGILKDTLARAKQRGVEPYQLGNTVYGHMLPAIIAPIASRRSATITADFVHTTATRFGE